MICKNGHEVSDKPPRGVSNSDWQWKSAKKHHACKHCIKAYRTKYYEANRERLRAGRMRHYYANLSESRAANRLWYAQNREHAIAYAKRYDSELARVPCSHCGVLFDGTYGQLRGQRRGERYYCSTTCREHAPQRRPHPDVVCTFYVASVCYNRRLYVTPGITTRPLRRRYGSALRSTLASRDVLGGPHLEQIVLRLCRERLGPPHRGREFWYASRGREALVLECASSVLDVEGGSGVSWVDAK